MVLLLRESMEKSEILTAMKTLATSFTNYHHHFLQSLSDLDSCIAHLTNTTPSSPFTPPPQTTTPTLEDLFKKLEIAMSTVAISKPGIGSVAPIKAPITPLQMSSLGNFNLSLQPPSVFASNKPVILHQSPVILRTLPSFISVKTPSTTPKDKPSQNHIHLDPIPVSRSPAPAPPKGLHIDLAGPIPRAFYVRTVFSWTEEPPGYLFFDHNSTLKSILDSQASDTYAAHNSSLVNFDWCELLIKRRPILISSFNWNCGDTHLGHAALPVELQNSVLCFCTKFGICLTLILVIGDCHLKMPHPCCILLNWIFYPVVWWCSWNKNAFCNVRNYVPHTYLYRIYVDGDSLMVEFTPLMSFGCVWGCNVRGECIRAQCYDKFFHHISILLSLQLVPPLVLSYGISEQQRLGVCDGACIFLRAAIISILLVVMVTAVSDYKQSLQFRDFDKEKSNATVQVTRDDSRKKISIYELVVRDVVNLSIGDQVPADGLFISGYSLYIDESSLSGENEPVNIERGIPFLLYGTKVQESSGKIFYGKSSYGSRITSFIVAASDKDFQTTKEKRYSFRLLPHTIKIYSSPGEFSFLHEPKKKYAMSMDYGVLDFPSFCYLKLSLMSGLFTIITTQQALAGSDAASSLQSILFDAGDVSTFCSLVYFGVSSLMNDASSSDGLKAEKEQKDAELSVSEVSVSGAGILYAANTVFSNFVLVFVNEWGDKPCFSAIALAAASSPLGVIAEALAGQGATTLLAVLGGFLLGTYLSEKALAYIGGTLFLVFAAVTLALAPALGPLTALLVQHATLKDVPLQVALLLHESRGNHHLEDKVVLKDWGNDTPQFKGQQLSTTQSKDPTQIRGPDNISPTSEKPHLHP